MPTLKLNVMLTRKSSLIKISQLVTTVFAELKIGKTSLENVSGSELTKFLLVQMKMVKTTFSLEVSCLMISNKVI